MRYSRGYKSSIVGISIGIIISLFALMTSIIAEIQYRELIVGMNTVEATVSDVSTRRRAKGVRKQDIEVTYYVGGEKFVRELGTDTPISMTAGHGTYYSVGDTVEIYYDPLDPMTIATELTSKTGLKIGILSAVCLAGCVVGFVSAIVNRKKFLVTEEEYRKEKEDKRREKDPYKGKAGYKIRVQYLNGILFGFLLVYLAVMTALSVNTAIGGEGTKLESPAEYFSMLLVVIVLSSPIWTLSLINRRFFGKVVCLLDEKGILYQRKRICWEKIDEIEYVIGFATKGGHSYARLIGDGVDVMVISAPVMIMGKAKKYKKNIKTRFSGKSILVITAIPILAIALMLLVML